MEIAVRAAPVDGAANRELCKLVARTLSVPKRAVRIAGGATGRAKTIVVEGVSKQSVQKALGCNDENQ